MRLIVVAVVLTLGVILAPLAAEAQATRTPQIGYLGTGDRDTGVRGNATAAGPFPDQDQGVLDRGAPVEVRQLEPENFSTMRTLLHR